MRFYGFGPSAARARTNQPVELEPLNEKFDRRTPAPTEEGDQYAQGFARLSTADPRTGIRPAIGGTPAYPAYHED